MRGLGSTEEEVVLKLANSGSVPTNRFVKEMRKSKEKIKELSQIIQEESLVLSKKQELELKIAKMSSENSLVSFDKKLLESQKSTQIESAPSNLKIMNAMFAVRQRAQWVKRASEELKALLERLEKYNASLESKKSNSFCC